MNVKNGKLDTWKTVLTGFGFLASSIAWAIYDPYITKILNKLLTESPFITELSAMLNEAFPHLADFARAQGNDVGFGTSISLVPLFIGIIMTFDNIFGVIFQPTFGKLSDNCHSKLGKRRPFIVFGAPVSAILFMLIPLIANGTGSLPATMVCIILFVFTMSLWRAPVVALMPDLTPPELRSEGNAIINLMGGIGGAVGMFAGTIASVLYTALYGEATEESQTFPIVFAIGTVVMIAGALVLLFFVKEQDSRIQVKAQNNQIADEEAKRKAEKAAAKEAKKALKAERKAQKLSKGERKSLIFMLGTLFFLFCAANAVTTFFSLFAQEILHMATATATIIMAVFAVCSAAAAIPAGKMGKKLGRKKTIISGLAVFMAAFLLFFSVFTIMVSTNGLSINKFIQANKVYSNVDVAINSINTDIKADFENTFEEEYKDLEKKEKKAKKAELEKDLQLLTIDGYTEYLKNTSVESNYAKVTEKLMETSGGAFSLDNFISTSENILGKEVAEKNYSEAFGNIVESVSGIVKVLQILILPVLIVAGFANMFITVNTLPLVLEIGGVDKVGTFTGYYYTATFSAQIASPIVYGFVAMITGTYMSLFYYSPIMFALAVILILFVKHGEAIPEALIKEAEEAND